MEHHALAPSKVYPYHRCHTRGRFPTTTSLRHSPHLLDRPLSFYYSSPRPSQATPIRAQRSPVLTAPASCHPNSASVIPSSTSSPPPPRGASRVTQDSETASGQNGHSTGGLFDPRSCARARDLFGAADVRCVGAAQGPRDQVAGLDCGAYRLTIAGCVAGGVVRDPYRDGRMGWSGAQYGLWGGTWLAGIKSVDEKRPGERQAPLQHSDMLSSHEVPHATPLAVGLVQYWLLKSDCCSRGVEGTNTN